VYAVLTALLVGTYVLVALLAGTFGDSALSASLAVSDGAPGSSLIRADYAVIGAGRPITATSI